MENNKIINVTLLDRLKLKFSKHLVDNTELVKDISEKIINLGYVSSSGKVELREGMYTSVYRDLSFVEKCTYVDDESIFFAVTPVSDFSVLIHKKDNIYLTNCQSGTYKVESENKSNLKSEFECLIDKMIISYNKDKL